MRQELTQLQHFLAHWRGARRLLPLLVSAPKGTTEVYVKNLGTVAKSAASGVRFLGSNPGSTNSYL